MPPQATDIAEAAGANAHKGLLGFIKSRVGSNRRWIGQSSHWPTVRALGQTWSAGAQRSARRPVWE
jgi:hypothetical protein